MREIQCMSVSLDSFQEKLVTTLSEMACELMNCYEKKLVNYLYDKKL